MYRAYLSQKKYGVIMDDIGASSPEELQAVKLLADYLSSDSSQKCVVIFNLQCFVVRLALQLRTKCRFIFLCTSGIFIYTT